MSSSSAFGMKDNAGKRVFFRFQAGIENQIEEATPRGTVQAHVEVLGIVFSLGKRKVYAKCTKQIAKSQRRSHRIRIAARATENRKNLLQGCANPIFTWKAGWQGWNKESFHRAQTCVEAALTGRQLCGRNRFLVRAAGGPRMDLEFCAIAATIKQAAWKRCRRRDGKPFPLLSIALK